MTLPSLLEKHEEFGVTPVEDSWGVQWYMMHLVKDMDIVETGGLLDYILSIEELWEMALLLPLEQTYFSISVKVNSLMSHCFTLENIGKFLSFVY